jgi:hypothetical protein
MSLKEQGAGQGAPKSLYPSEYKADGHPDQYAMSLHWIRERESIRRKRKAGEPRSPGHSILSWLLTGSAMSVAVTIGSRCGSAKTSAGAMQDTLTSG